MHVLVHEVQDGEPQGGKGGQRQQWRQVLQEDLEPTSQLLLAQGEEEPSVAVSKAERSWPCLASIQSEMTLKSRALLNPWAVSKAGGSERLHFLFGAHEKTWLLSVGKAGMG